MKRWSVVLALVASLGLLSSGLGAQDVETPPKPKRQDKPKKERPRPKKPLLRGEYMMMTRVCQLSEEQQKNIAELLARRGEELKPIDQKRKQVRAARAEARKNKDEDALKKANAEWKALNAERARLWKKWRTEILGALTPEQKAKWYEFTVTRFVKARFGGVKFTEDQTDKIKAAYVKHSTGVDLADDKARFQVIAKIAAVVAKEILTAEQRQTAAIESIKRQYRKAELTEEQLEQVKAAYAEYIKGAAVGDEKAWRAAMRKLSDHVRGRILTDQQREAVKKKVRPRKQRPAKKETPAGKQVEQPAGEPAGVSG